LEKKMNNTSCQKQNSEQKAAPTSTWWLLALAVFFEIAGATGLNFSDGFTSLLPTLLALAAFAVALYLVSHVMKSLPVSVAYPIWAGGGTAGVALLGVVLFDESMDIFKALGIALVIIGVITINRNSDKKSGC
jgi:small multidrug resistance pump